MLHIRRPKIACGIVSTLEINPAKMREALSVDMLATDVAYYLVRKGVSDNIVDRLCFLSHICFRKLQIAFRVAHGISGQVVKAAEDRGCALNDLPLSILQTIWSVCLARF